MFKLYKYLLVPVLIVSNISTAHANEAYEDINEWQGIPAYELDNMRGGFAANLGGIGVNLNWLVQVDVNETPVFSHDVTSDFEGKLININATGDVAVSDFQSLALVLQNSSDNINIQAHQMLDLQLVNISSFGDRALSARITDSIIHSISNSL